MRRRSLPVIVTTLLAAVAGPLHAQAAEPARTQGLAWGGEELRAGFCVHFLIDPSMTASLPFGGAALATAGRAPSIHPALKSALADSAAYASWIPSSLCLYQFGQLTTPSGTVTDRSEPQGFLVWSAPAAEAGRPAPAAMWVTNGRLARQASQPQVEIGRFELERAPVPETTKEQLTVKVGKTSITWQGRLGSDSSAVIAPVEAAWRMAGTQGSEWTARARFGARAERAMIGALGVEGKGELARILGASPIRFAGPIQVGGEGEVAFSR